MHSWPFVVSSQNAATLNRFAKQIRFRCTCSEGCTLACPCVFDHASSNCVPCRFLRGVYFMVRFKTWPRERSSTSAAVRRQRTKRSPHPAKHGVVSGFELMSQEPSSQTVTSTQSISESISNPQSQQSSSVSLLPTTSFYPSHPGNPIAMSQPSVPQKTLAEEPQCHAAQADHAASRIKVEQPLDDDLEKK